MLFAVNINKKEAIMLFVLEGRISEIRGTSFDMSREWIVSSAVVYSGVRHFCFIGDDGRTLGE
jgi:hypothetical protein